MDYPILIASGTKSGKHFKTEWYQPTLKNGKVPSLVVFRHRTVNLYYYGIIYQTENPPTDSFSQTRDLNIFKAHCVCLNQAGSASFGAGSNPRDYAYNAEYKLMALAINFESDYDVPSSIGGIRPSDLASGYTVPPDSVLTRFPYVGIIDTPEFWENVKDLKDKLAFEVDNSTTGGGDGEYDDNSSDTIGLPSLDSLNVNSISNTKFFSCYKMSPNQLSVLSEHLWTDWRNIAELIGNSILKPLDFIISLNMLPVDVDSTTKVIRMGWFDLNHAVQGGLINQQYVRVNCGSLTVKKKWGGAIDYQTDISLFLPFIGEVTLNANEVMGATLSVIYTVDVMSGNCIASVQVAKDNLNAILYQYNGNVASNFSITSLDYSNVMAGALQLAVAVGTGAGAGAGAFTAAVSSSSNLLSGAEVRRAGNLSATSGFMGIKKPYLILSRPIQSLPSEYNTFRGYVSNITLSLSECTGFTKVAEIHLENIPATSAELDELERLLKEGVIF